MRMRRTRQIVEESVAVEGSRKQKNRKYFDIHVARPLVM